MPNNSASCAAPAAKAIPASHAGNAPVRMDATATATSITAAGTAATVNSAQDRSAMAATSSGEDVPPATCARATWAPWATALTAAYPTPAPNARVEYRPVVDQAGIGWGRPWSLLFTAERAVACFALVGPLADRPDLLRLADRIRRARDHLFEDYPMAVLAAKPVDRGPIAHASHAPAARDMVVPESRGHRPRVRAAARPSEPERSLPQL